MTRRTLPVTLCGHVKGDGKRCRAWANKSGRCPTHDGKIPRLGGRPAWARKAGA